MTGLTAWILDWLHEYRIDWIKTLLTAWVLIQSERVIHAVKPQYQKYQGIASDEIERKIMKETEGDTETKRQGKKRVGVKGYMPAFLEFWVCYSPQDPYPHQPLLHLTFSHSLCCGVSEQCPQATLCGQVQCDPLHRFGRKYMKQLCLLVLLLLLLLGYLQRGLHCVCVRVYIRMCALKKWVLDSLCYVHMRYYLFLVRNFDRDCWKFKICSCSRSCSRSRSLSHTQIHTRTHTHPPTPAHTYTHIRILTDVDA